MTFYSALRGHGDTKMFSFTIQL